jgi:hypothetical protein
MNEMRCKQSRQKVVEIIQRLGSFAKETVQSSIGSVSRIQIAEFQRLTFELLYKHFVHRCQAALPQSDKPRLEEALVKTQARLRLLKDVAWGEVGEAQEDGDEDGGVEDIQTSLDTGRRRANDGVWALTGRSEGAVECQRAWNGPW